jgi:hypothetical protein
MRSLLGLGLGIGLRLGIGLGIGLLSSPAVGQVTAGPGLVVDDRGNPAELQALKRIAASLASARSAAGPLQQLGILGDAVIAFSSSAFSRVDDSTAFDPDRVAIQGTLAWASFNQSQLRVFLDEKLLPYSPDRVAPILAHELLGHSLPFLKADKAGLPRGLFARFDDAEVYALLTDAVVALELRLDSYDDQADRLSLSTAAYMADIRLLGAGYALMLARHEAADPAAVYRRRLGEARRALKDLDRQARRWKAREVLLRHLTGEDRRDSGLLRTAAKEVRYRLATHLPDLAERIPLTIKTLEEELAFGATPAGAADWKALSSAVHHPFFRDFDERLRRLHSRLKELRPDPKPRAKEWVDWSKVRALAEEDLGRHRGLDPKAVGEAF